MMMLSSLPHFVYPYEPEVSDEYEVSKPERNIPDKPSPSTDTPKTGDNVFLPLFILTSVISLAAVITQTKLKDR